MHSRLKAALTYTGIESCIYQIALFAHQYALYRYIGAETYGTIGTTFSVIYLISMYLNMGLDLSIAPLFGQGRENYLYARRLFGQITVNAIAGIVLYLITLITFQNVFALTKVQLLVCALLIISETTKKTLKSLLHLLFYHRYIAIIELASLTIYIITVWLGLLSDHTASITLIFCPLLATSLISLCLYSHPLLQWYHSLEKTTDHNSHHPITKMVLLRIQNYLYQISHSLYSPNFLIPLIAANYGMQLAALLKIMSMGIYSINSIIQHVFGITSTILFSHIKQSSVQQKQHILQTLQSYISKAIIFSATYSMLHYYLIHSSNQENLYIVYLFLLILCSEHITLAYEQFLIVEEQATFLILCNIGLFIPTLLAKNFTNVTITSLLLVLTITRAIHLLLIYLYGSFYRQSPIAWYKKPFYTKPVA